MEGSLPAPRPDPEQLQQPLLRRDPATQRLVVNFDVQLVRVLREVPPGPGSWSNAQTACMVKALRRMLLNVSGI